VSDGSDFWRDILATLPNPPRVLVCGSRDYTDLATMRDVLASLPAVAQLIHGGAQGADTLAESIARERGWSFVTYPADWQTYGRAAGPIRNNQMLRDGAPDLVIAFRSRPDSRGTNDMIQQARKAGVPVVVVEDRAVVRL
jgi:ABC-type Fe3+-hydroxamate transport system substrate-binding protein